MTPLRSPSSLVVQTLLLASLPGCYSGTSLDTDTDTGAGAGTDAGTSVDEEGSGSDEGGGSDGPVPACDDTRVPGTVALRRLTRTQYDNTIAALVRWAAPDDAAAILSEIDPLLAQVPDDLRQPSAGQHLGGYRRLDQAVQQQHIDATYRVARAVAQAIAVPTRLEALVGTCATDADPSNDEACIDAAIRSFAERALRRPISDEETARFRAIFDGDGTTSGTEPEAFVDVFSALMVSPHFLYMVEHGTDESPQLPGMFVLSDWEVASRLSYHFWQGPPDDELRDAARSGMLSTDAGYAEQVERMFEDPRARAAVGSFYRDWLWLDSVAAVDGLLGDPRYDAFLGATPVDDQTHLNMVQEVIDMATYYTFDVDGMFDDLLLSDRSFARTPDLAGIYGVAPWEGGEPPVFPDAERVGVLGRAAMLSNRSEATRPIMKGVLIRTAMLCDQLPPPPPDAEMNVPEFDGEMTTREIVEALTEDPAGSCSACHTPLINPLGFASEGFDALGRHRTEQRIFDADGNLVAARAVDTTVTPNIDPGDTREVSNLRELAERLSESEKVRACFARNYFRFTFARDEDLEQDACALQSLVDNLEGGATLAETLRDIALRPEFRQRSFD